MRAAEEAKREGEKKNFEKNSVAQHWARDWRALALTQEKKNFTRQKELGKLGTGLARTGTNTAHRYTEKNLKGLATDEGDGFLRIGIGEGLRREKGRGRSPRVGDG